MSEIRTKSGRVLTDAEIEALVDEAEAGYELSQLRPVDREVREYSVNWLIEVEAATPRAAALEALRLMRDPESTATVFDVAEREHHYVVDLDGEWPDEPQGESEDD